ncbi:hypothetical protein EJ02DRAFT_379113 [Clathrospora elynae]|uniref:Dol-P-Glc:Glc(2)Man(9)GlcNAc(2)-PP-Dol alpha-1,2-glucosyltransferase n=1 Tax=Clathrospora elynae TaxID=706981 RepID=A0A6A5SJH9_9PLEO|nr:hypothetical protein EJ02DRAFT_379113 [Clathrospora elynae]
MPAILQTWALPVALLVIVNVTATWYNLLSTEVPKPYLDEYFHVAQSQKYCKGDYSWDPKITTPPGLYLVSKLLAPFLGCDTSSLRALNAGAICLICLLSCGILRRLRARNNPINQETKGVRTSEPQNLVDCRARALDAHSALNIALFPPLFFFSALYYTDVMSTMVVLLSYSGYLTSESVAGELSTVFIGVSALFFRQTNIFWVAIFPAGLAVVDVLKREAEHPASPTVGDYKAILHDSWSKGIIYDCSIQDAGPQDYMLFLVSVAISACKNPMRVIRVAMPYISLVMIFAGFVAWNGSVVLGDKSAHTATIHLPQMLYLWPYIAFFSAPLLAGPLLQPVVPLLPKRLQTVCKSNLNVSSKIRPPTFLVSTLFIAGGLIAVHLNTIIHPYTLADNRHYVFYVFKILRLYPAIKYLAVPVYCICAWLTIQSLASPSVGEDAPERKRDDCPTSIQASRQPCHISFVTIWLATTALSVITTPLVEPRYFIIPWIMWRLHVPYSPASLSQHRSTDKPSYDIRLVLETIWVLTINAAVSYTFLYRTFAWPSEPDNLQRFIW